MFKYTVAVKLKNSARGAAVTIKTDVDWDVNNKMEALGFLGAHNVRPAMERMFGQDNVEDCVVTEKTQMLVRT